MKVASANLLEHYARQQRVRAEWPYQPTPLEVLPLDALRQLMEFQAERDRRLFDDAMRAPTLRAVMNLVAPVPKRELA